MTRHVALLAACLFCASGALFMSTAQTAADDEKSSVIYELRTYTTEEGKLPLLHKRFSDHTMKLFEKHGIKNVIYWTPTDKEDTLVYVIAHKSREAADQSWEAFRNDPQWHKVRDASGVGSVKVQRQFLETTDYSPRK